MMETREQVYYKIFPQQQEYVFIGTHIFKM